MKKTLIIGCSILAGLALIGVIVVVVLVAYFAQDPKGVAVHLEGGTEAQVGKEFELVVKVTNQRSSKSFKLSDIDIHEEYMKGFVVVGTDPEAKASTHVPLANIRSFTFDLTIPANQSQEFKFKLRPRETGFFKGEVDIGEGGRTITTTAETEVK